MLAVYMVITLETNILIRGGGANLQWNPTHVEIMKTVAISHFKRGLILLTDDLDCRHYLGMGCI